MELNCVNVWKTNKKAAVWAVLALVLTAALLTGCGAPQAGPSYHCTVSISCASILEHMELRSEEKRELVPGGRLAAGVCRGQLSGGPERF